MPFDDCRCWEHIELREAEQRAYYECLFRDHPPLDFPERHTSEFHYHYKNDMFPLADAITLSSILRHERPHRIIEVGCGFSSAVMLDTIEREKRTVALTFIDPSPESLKLQTYPASRAVCKMLATDVQKVPIALFKETQGSGHPLHRLVPRREGR